MSVVQQAIAVLTELGHDYDRLADQSTLNLLLGAPDEGGDHPRTAATIIGLAFLCDDLAYDLARATGSTRAQVLRTRALKAARGE